MELTDLDLLKHDTKNTMILRNTMFFLEKNKLFIF